MIRKMQQELLAMRGVCARHAPASRLSHKRAYERAHLQSGAHLRAPSADSESLYVVRQGQVAVEPPRTPTRETLALQRRAHYASEVRRAPRQGVERS
jgi:hypothetical protein